MCIWSLRKLLCTFFLQAALTPPKNLDELLKTTSDINFKDIDKTIDSNLWTKKLKAYLEKREKSAEELSNLKFLLKMQAFDREKNEGLKLQIFANILKSHFDIEADVLALSNSSVSDYLCQRTAE